MVTSRPFLSPQTATRIKGLRQRGFDTIALFFDDAYEVHRLNRPGGWDDATDDEDWDTVEEGVGRIYETGSGGDQADEAVIIGLSPYRFRLQATSGIQDTDKLVVNGREFLVQSVTRGDTDDRFADVYLQERTP